MRRSCTSVQKSIEFNANERISCTFRLATSAWDVAEFDEEWLSLKRFRADSDADSSLADEEGTHCCVINFFKLSRISSVCNMTWSPPVDGSIIFTEAGDAYRNLADLLGSLLVAAVEVKPFPAKQAIPVPIMVVEWRHRRQRYR